jgi:hypothetical protein
MTTALLGLALASTAVAQQLQEDFPAKRTSAVSCADVNWNKDMLLNHPSLVDACQEVIVVEGETWARFAAKFVRIEPNGDVIFSVRDQNDRSIEEVTLDPTPGQVAYINDRATPFSQLRTTDSISLYVPEGQYGFATQPGVPREQLATVVVPADSTTSRSAAPVVTTTTTDRTAAERDSSPAVLPTTAGPLPWLALVGFLSMLGGLGLTLRRWN